jgi:uncharacterized protein HemX
MADEPLMVERSEVEAKARQIQQALVETKEAAQNTAVLAAVAVVLGLGAAFLLGRRRGRSGRAVVEVYKV